MTITIIQPGVPTVNVLEGSAGAIAVLGGVAIPGPGPTSEQIAEAVAEYFLANPPADGANATDAQVAEALAAYLLANPIRDGEDGTDATNEQIAAAVASYLSAHPPEDGADATDEQVYEAVTAYAVANPVPEAIPLALKGERFGVAELDGSGGLAQRMKVAGGSTPAAIRDTEGEGNGKASIIPASIATNGATTILVKTWVWQSELDYAFRVFGTTSAGVVNVSIYRVLASGSPVYGYTNNGNVPVTVIFGVFGDGYSGWAILSADFGRAQFVVTDAAVVGNGTGDPQVRDWSMQSAADAGLLNSQVIVPRRTLE